MAFKHFQQTTFLKSAEKPEHFPVDKGIEIAFAGRSNAGKSTVINAITGQNIARVSKTPGRTRLVNFFPVAENKTLVDLPGFGYAKVPLSMQANWQALLENYFANRRALKGVVLIMDIRHPLTPKDNMMIDYCDSYLIPTHILLNKADKLSRNQVNQTINSVKKQIKDLAIKPSLQAFSSPKKIGFEQLQELLTLWFDFN